MSRDFSAVNALLVHTSIDLSETVISAAPNVVIVVVIKRNRLLQRKRFCLFLHIFCLSVFCLTHSCTLLKSFDALVCHLAGMESSDTLC